MQKKKTLRIVIAILIVAVIVTGIFLGRRLLLHERYQNEQIDILQNELTCNEARIEELHEEIIRLNKVAASLDTSNGFYQKLRDGHFVNILIVGDSIGAGTGASDSKNRWYNLLVTWIRQVYGADCTLTNISMGGNTSYAGYAREMILDDGIEYDLAIICYGENDSEDGFSANYEAIIRGILKKYSSCSMIAILESSQRTYTSKMQEIKKLAAYYGIPVADTIKAFDESGYEYDDLAQDGTHPTDVGQRIYYETIRDIITDQTAKNAEFEKADLKPVNAEVIEYDNFRYFSKTDFVRTGVLTWEAETDQIEGIMGIYRSFDSGDCTLKVYIDDILLAEFPMDWQYEFSQTEFVKLREETCIVNKSIKLEFASKEQADGFEGLLFTGLH